MIDLSKGNKNSAIGFNIRHIKEYSPEIWDKYQNEFEKYPQIDEVESVYMDQLIAYIDGDVLLQILEDCMQKIGLKT